MFILAKFLGKNLTLTSSNILKFNVKSYNIHLKISYLSQYIKLNLQYDKKLKIIEINHRLQKPEFHQPLKPSHASRTFSQNINYH